MDSTYSMNIVSQSFSNLNFIADDNSIYPTNTIGLNKNKTIGSEISIYPNPAKNIINIKFQSSDKITGQIEIIDNLGKIVVSKKLVSELTQLNIEELNSGFYFIKVKSESGVNTFRFIKQ